MSGGCEDLRVESVSANCAFLVFAAVFGTRRRFDFVLQTVPVDFYFLCIAVAANGTGICPLAFLCTGWCSRHFRVIFVPDSSDGFFVDLLAADRAFVILAAVFCAACRFCLMLQAVFQHVDFFRVAVAADRTGIRSLALRRTGRLLCYGRYIAMGMCKRVGVGIRITIAADHAGVCRIAALKHCRLNNRIHILMPGRLNRLGVTVAADRTGICPLTVLCTGWIDCDFRVILMPGGRRRLDDVQLSAAYGTQIILASVLCAGRFFRLVLGRMSDDGEFHGVAFTADRTAIGICADLGLRRCDRLHPFVVVRMLRMRTDLERVAVRVGIFFRVTVFSRRADVCSCRLAVKDILADVLRKPGDMHRVGAAREGIVADRAHGIRKDNGAQRR